MLPKTKVVQGICRWAGQKLNGAEMNDIIVHPKIYTRDSMKLEVMCISKA